MDINSRLQMRLQPFRARMTVILAAASAGTAGVFLLASQLGILNFTPAHRLIDLGLLVFCLSVGWVAHIRPQWANHVFFLMAVGGVLVLAGINLIDPQRYHQFFLYGLILFGSFMILGVIGRVLLTMLMLGVLLVFHARIAAVGGLDTYAYLVLFILMAVFISTLVSVYLYRYFVFLAKEEVSLYKVATRDPLTRLLNRRGFLEQANVLFAEAHRNGSPLSLAIIDLDHFKLINDIHGHEVGDRALVHVAELMRQVFRRQSDQLGRFGGDEMVVLMPGITLEEAHALLRRLRERLRQSPLMQGQIQVSLTLSIGVAEFSSQDDHRLSDLMRRADLALYEAKRAGRDGIILASSSSWEDMNHQLNELYASGAKPSVEQG